MLSDENLNQVQAYLDEMEAIQNIVDEQMKKVEVIKEMLLQVVRDGFSEVKENAD